MIWLNCKESSLTYPNNNNPLKYYTMKQTKVLLQLDKRKTNDSQYPHVHHTSHMNQKLQLVFQLGLTSQTNHY